VQSAFYTGYFVFAIPAALFIRRFGYKAAVICGLLLYACGAFLFTPAAQLHNYAFFLAALFVIASGLAFLETSANPLITVLGHPDKSEQRLNFAQAFNPVGLFIGVFIGREYILSETDVTQAQLDAMSAADLARYYEAQSQAVQGPYLLIGAVIVAWALMVALTPFPKIATERAAQTQASGGFAQLFTRKHFLFGVAAQFFYVAAQVGVLSFTIRYAQVSAGASERGGADLLMASIFAFLVGRFIGAWLLGVVKPERLMTIYAGANVVLVLIAAMVGGDIGTYALAATSFFMSIMFPTIFASSLRGLGELTKSGSSFLVMAIIGGALVAPIMGAISDASSMQTAMFVPALCFVVIFLFSTLSRAPQET
jgi:FHS family L-fucose permease-like MFS transporter